MLPLLLAGVLGGFLGHLFDMDGNFIGMALGSFFGLAVGCVVAGCLGAKLERWELISRRNLGSLHNSGTLEGSFFLGCGTIGTDPYYVYYEQQPDGGYVYRRRRADDSNVIVYEEERTDGVLEYCEKMPPNWSLVWLTFWAIEVTYKFRIPKGSIKREFSL